MQQQAKTTEGLIHELISYLKSFKRGMYLKNLRFCSELRKHDEYSELTDTKIKSLFTRAMFVLSSCKIVSQFNGRTFIANIDMDSVDLVDLLGKLRFGVYYAKHETRAAHA